MEDTELIFDVQKLLASVKAGVLYLFMGRTHERGDEKDMHKLKSQDDNHALLSREKQRRNC